mmetsp:Transcript_111935/g.222479  ORF Transcript_111935/g.222479 Transcript_111935/m.222479 type:complete len:96 (+) Transcript_111935:103-390(+)
MRECAQPLHTEAEHSYAEISTSAPRCRLPYTTKADVATPLATSQEHGFPLSLNPEQQFTKTFPQEPQSGEPASPVPFRSLQAHGAPDTSDAMQQP